MTIQKGRKLPIEIDYEALRKEGLKHIEELSSALWTDYNVHDPGITILEALCYAITELGYRSGFDIKDLLADESGYTGTDQVFFTAKNILTVNPLTVTDYRKLLIDIEGVGNAWLIADDTKPVNGKAEAINEVPLYADCLLDKLVTVPNDAPLFLSGLYQVLLSLEHHDRFGDLNDGDIVIGNPELTGKFFDSEFYFSIELPSWKQADYVFAELAKEENNIGSALLTAVDEGWECELTVTGAPQPFRFGTRLSKKPVSGAVATADVQAMFNDASFIARIFTEYFEKIKLSRTIIRKATKALHEHRNLCEDYLSITTVENDPVAFCFDVDVTPAADIEKVQAEIFYAIETYLNPPIDFYSLKDLLGKELPIDEIFNGPVLEHGFVDTVQLETTDLRKEIFASDIINLLMDIEGVSSIRNFLMTKYGADGKPLPLFKSLKWCMPVKPLHKPVLRIDKSKILLFKSGFPFIARYDEVKDTILLLHTIRSKAKLSGLQDDLPLPKGTKRDTESYWPVQYDLPMTYGTGEAGLPLGITQERRAQQRQLKGYLMFYEQVLADFFSQLSNARELYSTNNLTHTYYAQFLSGINDIDLIYKPNLASSTLKDAITNSDATTAATNSWQELYETKAVFEARRGRFLDHLLGRFAESFNDYALLMYRVNYEEATQEKISYEDVATAKINTLRQYDEISKNRGRAFNYFPQTTQVSGNDLMFLPDTTKCWNTSNVSGLEKRISALTGIKDSTRRFLFCIQNIDITCTEKEVSINGNTVLQCIHSFRLTSLNGIELISKEYGTKEEAEEALKEVISRGRDMASYSVVEDVKFKIQMGDLLTGLNEYHTEENAVEAINALAGEMAEKCNDPEGLHLIEHILLRPRTQPFNLAPVCLHDCDCACEQDPYSFRASVVLPYWPGHFDHPAFRQYFENKIREEAPAHVMLKICWLNNDLMRGFETAYKTWVEALAAYTEDSEANENTFRVANNRMIELLSGLHSEYPLATLHNCDESAEGNNTVVLNKTVLGTFKT